jgi:hypothetical protein
MSLQEFTHPDWLRGRPSLPQAVKRGAAVSFHFYILVFSPSLCLGIERVVARSNDRVSQLCKRQNSY